MQEDNPTSTPLPTGEGKTFKVLLVSDYIEELSDYAIIGRFMSGIYSYEVNA